LDVQQATREADIDDIIRTLAEEEQAPAAIVTYARTLSWGAWLSRERYDDMVSGVSAHWKVSRMAVVDRNILRIALYELIEQPDVPVRVVFDEAIEIGKQFGTRETPQFINGVLDAIWKNHPACRIARGDEGRSG
jgi:N utilization substance protein B